MTIAPPIDVLVADDERPALDELVHLLRTDPRVGEILTASSGAEALRVLSERAVRIAFLDIHMPGLNGMELARALMTLAEPPSVVFVTADEARAVEAFELRAADYLLKPVRLERLRQAVARVVELGDTAGLGDDEVLPVTVGSVVRFVRRSEVRWV
ncbi:response regulator, partial [Microbacterium maritypicum]